LDVVAARVGDHVSALGGQSEEVGLRPLCSSCPGRIPSRRNRVAAGNGTRAPIPWRSTGLEPTTGDKRAMKIIVVYDTSGRIRSIGVPARSSTGKAAMRGPARHQLLEVDTPEVNAENDHEALQALRQH